MRSYILLFLFLSTSQLSRSQSRTSDISRYLYNPFLNNYTCQEKITDIQLSYNPGGGDQTPNPVSNYFEIYERPDHTCQVLRYTITENSSLKLEGAGISVNSLQRNQNNTWIANVKFNASGAFQVSWQVRNYYPSNTCNLVSDTITYVGTYRKIVAIPPPPKPTLSPLKAVVRFQEGTLINTSGCPNTLKDNDAIPPSYVPLSRADWSWTCGPDGKPEFTSNGRTDGNSPFDFVPYNPAVYKPGTVFRARCDDNGCVGPVSNPVAVSIQRTIPDCGDSNMNEIDNFTNDGRLDYHHYMVETEICNKADGNPNCTRENVFALLKSSKIYSAVIAQDFPGTVPISPSALRAKVNMFGSDMVFKLSDTPVVNCETVNLPSALGLSLNMVALDAYENYKDESLQTITRYATSLNPIANPVALFIDEPAFTITNYTKLGHIFHPGKITRIVVDECDRIKVITIGSGRQFFGNNKAGFTMGLINTISGRQLFSNLDKRVIEAFNKQPK